MRRFIPSPALLVALIALFVALGGTSYAAITSIPANSVGTKQLKDGAVTAAKISSSALEKAKVVGKSGAPAYAGQWESAGGGDEGVSFYKDPFGIVHLQGSADNSGGATTGRIFTLPLGYRPAGYLYFTVYGNVGVAGYIQISHNGAVSVFSTSKSYVGLSNISFRAGL
jgi:hypothetical protein